MPFVTCNFQLIARSVGIGEEMMPHRSSDSNNPKDSNNTGTSTNSQPEPEAQFSADPRTQVQKRTRKTPA